MHLNADHLRSFDLDTISRFERDISTALVVVRGWMNTFARINRIPLDILCLIPTYLSSQKDRFRASFVCRHWRRAFLQYAALWSQLVLKDNEEYVTTLLERAKGSALDVVAIRGARLGTVALLSPHTLQIRHLRFPHNNWTDILRFSGVNSGPLPLLRTLYIRLAESNDQLGMLTLPSFPLLSGAANLEEFVLDSMMGSNWLIPLNSFVFPNLTTFKLSTIPTPEFKASDFLGFLKASPTLQTVETHVYGYLRLEDIPQDMLVVLPNVETFSLSGRDKGWHVYRLAMHISCPHADHTSLVQEVYDYDMTPGLEIFPDPASWETIVHQYSTGPTEEVTFGVKDHKFTTYFLTFQSHDTVIRLGFNLFASGAEEEELDLPWEEMDVEIFSQACSTIVGHPLLSHVKRLCIEGWTTVLATSSADVVVELFRCLGPLDELTFDGCNLEMFLAPFINLPEFGRFARVFPHVKKLTISEGQMVDKWFYMDTIVELAKSQYEQGKPLEHVVVGMSGIPAEMVEKLREWVGAADCGQI
jgi:hypothetical protein